jgi:hypothetical protein
MWHSEVRSLSSTADRARKNLDAINNFGKKDKIEVYAGANTIVEVNVKTKRNKSGVDVGRKKKGEGHKMSEEDKWKNILRGGTGMERDTAPSGRPKSKVEEKRLIGKGNKNAAAAVRAGGNAEKVKNRSKRYGCMF